MTVNKINTAFELGFDVPALPGMAVNDIQTPCLILDLDSFDHNLKRMAEVITPYNVSLRAHAKMHKSIDVARQQMTHGEAIGICCQKVSEAEVFAKAGIPDILITNQVCDQIKIERLAGIAGLGCRLSVCVDDRANIDVLSAEAKKQNVHIHCLVEIDCGAGRCGVADAEQVTELAAAINTAEYLIFDGLQAYQGSIQHEPNHHKRKTELDAVIVKVKACLDSLAAEALIAQLSAAAAQAAFPWRRYQASIRKFNAGLTPLWMLIMAEFKIKMETGWIRQIGRMRCFLFTSIMSTAKNGQAICDAGLKVQSVDSGMPVIFGRDDISYKACSDEHGIIDDKKNQLKINDKLLLVPGHCDPTCNLHDWYVCVRDGKVVELWPVSARGKAM